MTKRLARVLLADDNPVDLELFQIFVMQEELLEMELETVEYGEAVLERLQDHSKPLPDLVLLDINMPRMDGFEVLAELRLQGATAKIPVGMLTTSDDEYDINHARRLGANGFLTKPANLEQLQQFAQSSRSKLQCIESNPGWKMVVETDDPPAISAT